MDLSKPMSVLKEACDLADKEGVTQVVVRTSDGDDVISIASVKELLKCAESGMEPWRTVSLVVDLPQALYDQCLKSVHDNPDLAVSMCIEHSIRNFLKLEAK